MAAEGGGRRATWRARHGAYAHDGACAATWRRAAVARAHYGARAATRAQGDACAPPRRTRHGGARDGALLGILDGAGHTTDGDLKSKRLGHGTRKHLCARALGEAATDAHGRLTGSYPLRVFCAVLGLLRRLPLLLLLLLLLPLLPLLLALSLKGFPLLRGHLRQGSLTQLARLERGSLCMHLTQHLGQPGVGVVDR